MEETPNKKMNHEPQDGNSPLPSFSDPATEKLLESTVQSPEKEAAACPDRELCREIRVQLNQLLPLLSDKMTHIESELQRLKTDDQCLAYISSRCQALEERHYEQEVLTPLFQALIHLADRCRQQISAITKRLDNETLHSAAGSALRYLMQARDADRIEVETLLAQYGVESYEKTTAQFDPKIHKAIKRIPSLQASTYGQIVHYYLPGYRRGERIIRPEYVSVFVQTEPENSQKGASL